VNLDLLLVGALVGAPLLAAAVTALAPDDDAALRRGRSLLVAALAVSLAALARVVLRGPTTLDPNAWTVLDGGNVTSLLLLTVAALAGLWSSPRAQLGKGSVVALLGSLAAMSALLVAERVPAEAAAWVVSMAPTRLLLDAVEDADERRRALRAHALTAGSGAALMGAFVLGWALVGGAHGHPLRPSTQRDLMALLALAAVVRMGAMPFHGLLPTLFARGPLGIFLAIGNMHAAMHLLTDVAMPLLPDAYREAVPALRALGVLGALAGALMALAQTDLTRALGMIAVSQVGMVLAGVGAMNHPGVSGAMLQTCALTVVWGALSTVAGAIRARAGTTVIARLGAVALDAPGLAVFFLLFSLASAGFPGGPTFPSEDLILHGLLDGHPWMAAVLLATTALHGIVLFRLFGQVFFGPRRVGAPAHAALPDLLPRERAVLTALFLLALALGVAPGPVAALVDPVVARVIAA